MFEEEPITLDKGGRMSKLRKLENMDVNFKPASWSSVAEICDLKIIEENANLPIGYIMTFKKGKKPKIYQIPTEELLSKSNEYMTFTYRKPTE